MEVQMAGETTSEAKGQGLQEQEQVDVSAQETTQPPTSEGQVPAVQEQKVEQPPELTDQQIEALLSRKDVQARMYQRAQSMKDKELQQERLRREGEAEKQRVASMDDDEYGRYVRQRTNVEQVARKLAIQEMGRQMAEVQTQALAQISDKKLRAEMEAKASTFTSLPDFFRACVKAEADHQIQRELAKKEPEVREAITKELTASQEDELYPQLGRGLPVGRESDLHGRELITAAYAEERRKRSQKG